MTLLWLDLILIIVQANGLKDGCQQNIITRFHDAFDHPVTIEGIQIVHKNRYARINRNDIPFKFSGFDADQPAFRAAFALFFSLVTFHHGGRLGNGFN
jgi:hypothetical protein